MGVEYLLSSRFGEILERTKLEEEKSSYRRSPLFTVATAFCKEGRNELLKITEYLKKNNIVLNEDDGFESLPRHCKSSAILNFAAVIFGMTLIFNERALVEKEVNSKYLTMSYNLLFRDTFVPQIEQDNEEIEKLSSKQHADLIKIVDIKHPDNADRSLASLYQDKLNLMPKLIKNVLEETGTLPIIKREFLSRYDWYVRELIISDAIQAERLKLIRHNQSL